MKNVMAIPSICRGYIPCLKKRILMRVVDIFRVVITNGTICCLKSLIIQNTTIWPTAPKDPKIIK